MDDSDTLFSTLDAIKQGRDRARGPFVLGLAGFIAVAAVALIACGRL